MSVSSPDPVVLPVRYALGPHAVQATTRQLSLERAFIRSITPPHPGLKVAIRIYFAEGKPEDFVAVVENRERPAQETGGFWARFELVTAQARERILVATGAMQSVSRPAHRTSSSGVAAVQAPGLRQTQAGTPALPAPHQGGRPELRGTVRRAATLRTRFKTVAALREEVSRNISAGGMFIQTEEAPPLREVVLLSIELPGEREPLEVAAEVMHVVKPADATALLPAGVGVQFVQADDRFRERLDRYLATHQRE